MYPLQSMQNSSAKLRLRSAIAEDALEASSRFSDFEALAASTPPNEGLPRPTLEDYLRTWDQGLTSNRSSPGLKLPAILKG
jgi:hypothetical protein